jgi:hypothetical protein
VDQTTKKMGRVDKRGIDKMRMIMVKSLWIILMVLVISDIASIRVYAKESVSCSGTFSYPTRPDEQWRFITVIKDPAWTKLASVEGQPTKGTYLEKGDSLFYEEEALKADTSGYYVIKTKKKIRPTIQLIQYRHNKSGKWGSWEEASVYSETYETVQSYSTLVKQ